MQESIYTDLIWNAAKLASVLIISMTVFSKPVVGINTNKQGQSWKRSLKTRGKKKERTPELTERLEKANAGKMTLKVYRGPGK